MNDLLQPATHYAAPPLILGAGGFGRQLAAWLAAEEYGEAEFLDDAAPAAIGKLADYTDPAVCRLPRAAFVGLGNNTLRCELLQKLRDAGYETPVFVSNRAALSPDAVLGKGTVVLPLAYVGTGVTTGEGCIVNAGALIDHDVTLGRGVHAAPGAIIKAGATLPDLCKVDSGEVVHSPWEAR